jgi:hypothetical protein
MYAPLFQVNFDSIVHDMCRTDIGYELFWDKGDDDETLTFENFMGMEKRSYVNFSTCK